MAKSPKPLIEPVEVEVPEIITPTQPVTSENVPEVQPIQVGSDEASRSSALKTLCEMGFIDSEKNEVALENAKGNIEGAIVLLLSN